MLPFSLMCPYCQVEMTKLLMEGLSHSKTNHRQHLLAFVESQVRLYWPCRCSDACMQVQYYAAAHAVMQQLDKQMLRSPTCNPCTLHTILCYSGSLDTAEDEATTMLTGEVNGVDSVQVNKTLKCKKTQKKTSKCWQEEEKLSSRETNNFLVKGIQWLGALHIAPLWPKSMYKFDKILPNQYLFSGQLDSYQPDLSYISTLCPCSVDPEHSSYPS